jgi:hypothetical protein
LLDDSFLMEIETMAKSKHHDDDRKRDRDREHEPEHDEGNRAHIEIEERRFRGGQPPTPDLYERAREQWNQLPGAVEKSPADPVKNKPPVDSETKPTEPGADEGKEERP